MSAFVVSKRHIDALVTAGLSLPQNYGPMGWTIPAPPAEAAYQRGAAWGPAAQSEYEAHHRTLRRTDAGRVGAMLWAENERSVNHRYDEEGIEEPYVYQRYKGAPDLSPTVVLKLISCYEYQSCEHPEWKQSEAFAFCQSLRKAVIGELAGYDAAPWGID